jgi:hypothetical protein
MLVAQKGHCNGNSAALIRGGEHLAGGAATSRAILVILSILPKLRVLAPLREAIRRLKSKILILLFSLVHPVKASPTKSNLIQHFLKKNLHCTKNLAQRTYSPDGRDAVTRLQRPLRECLNHV